MRVRERERERESGKRVQNGIVNKQFTSWPSMILAILCPLVGNYGSRVKTPSKNAFLLGDAWRRRKKQFAFLASTTPRCESPFVFLSASDSDSDF